MHPIIRNALIGGGGGGGGGAPVFSPIDLFQASETGVWYDPSDLTTVFLDTAGTTPVQPIGTVADQAVARINDKSGNGKNATQATSSSRPSLSALKNLEVSTESLSGWRAAGVTFGSSAVVTPASTTTATLITCGGGASNYIDDYPTNYGSFQSVTQTLSIYVHESSTCATVTIDINSYKAVFSLATKAFTSVNVYYIDTTAVHVGGGWWRISATGVKSNMFNFWRVHVDYGVSSSLNALLWGAQLENAAAPTAYQRVTSLSNYDASTGYPHLKFDGVDDSLVTGSIDWSVTSYMLFSAGVLFNANTSNQTILSTGDGTNGTLEVRGFPTGAGTLGLYNISQSGTVSSPQASVLNAGKKHVATGIGDLTTPNTHVQCSEITLQSAAAPAGGGPYAANVLYIGSRGSGLRLNGQVFSVVARGASTSAGDITSLEAWINAKTGAY